MRQIDKDIPLDSGVRKQRESRFSWLKDTLLVMEVGDSFRIEGDEYKSLRVRVSMVSKSIGRHFITRAMEDGSYRCWRTR